VVVSTQSRFIFNNVFLVFGQDDVLLLKTCMFCLPPRGVIFLCVSIKYFEGLSLLYSRDIAWSVCF